MRRRRDPNRRAAGDVLVIGVAALVLAALVNADALVRRAEQKPLGPGRDRSLAIWHPVQDVSHILQLHRIRQLGDAIAGNDDDEPTSLMTSTTSPGATTTVPPRPEVRTPSPADPLRLWVGGDSIVRDFGESVLRLAAPDPRYAPVLHYEISSGLTRPDYYDWPAALQEDMAATDPEVVVIMFGANDGQGIITADGRAIQRVSDPGWTDEYALRVGAVMDLLRDDDRLAYWVLQPPMRDGDLDARIDLINEVYVEEAEGRPWIEVVDTTPLFGDADGDYAAQLPGPGGGVADLRQGDGIHLSRAGADLLAAHVLGLLEAELRSAAGSDPGSG